MDKIYLPSPVRFVMERLKGSGYSAYAVGGCVRDSLMGRIPGDYDVTTNARPEEMLRVFDGCRVIETGLKHGTLTVLHDGMTVEVTAYRIDGSYADGRHPDSVTFTDSLPQDLCRRDFTINAMAYSDGEGIVDLYGGREDIERRVVRCVGSADERFTEDGLRILRALRFSAALDFTPDCECDSSVRRLKELLGKISRERIFTELTKLLSGCGCGRILSLYPEVIAFLLPPLSEEAAVRAAGEIIKAQDDSEVRYAILLDSLELSDAVQAYDSLKPSRAQKNAVTSLLKYKNYFADYGSDELSLLRLISKTDDGFIPRLSDYLAAVGRITDEEKSKVNRRVDEIIAENRPRKLCDLAIGGKELTELGFKGREIGDALTELLEKVMCGEVRNYAESLTEAAKEIKNA